MIILLYGKQTHHYTTGDVPRLHGEDSGGQMPPESMGGLQLSGYKGMFRTELRTITGAWKTCWVYVVYRARPEPLLGDSDAEEVGIVTFHPEGRELAAVHSISILAELRKACIKVCTEKQKLHNITKKGKEDS